MHFCVANLEPNAIRNISIYNEVENEVDMTRIDTRMLELPKNCRVEHDKPLEFLRSALRAGNVIVSRQ
jgi:hypothetical protein